MRYEYSGFLQRLLDRPDPTVRDELDHIEFAPRDMVEWDMVDDEEDREWQSVPGFTEGTDEGVLLRGHFENVRRIENVAKNDPSFWIALSSRKRDDGRFPIDLKRYPIVEVSYRCHTPNAHPAWVGAYPGGDYFDGLQPVRDWRTIARRVPHFGFPDQFTALTLRLYATARSREAVEFGPIRFRAMSPAEADACAARYAALEAVGPAERHAVLDEFMPIGVYMKAGFTKRLAQELDISFRDYWRLALEDVVRHHHNCVMLEEAETLTPDQWVELLDLAQSFALRLVGKYDWPMDELDPDGPELRQLVDTHIRPYAESPAVLAWEVQNEPPDRSFDAYLSARELIREADPNHPLTGMMREPDAFPLFGRFLAASGMTYFKSHAAYGLGERIRTHIPLCHGQQFWILAPAFVYGTDTPEWSTCPEMRLMINLAFASGARGWFTFTYHNEPIWMGGYCQRSLTGPFLTFSDLWSELGNHMERLGALAPLFLSGTPVADGEEGVQITYREHPRGQRAEGATPVDWYWFEGEDFKLLYVVNNDIAEVTGAYIDVVGELAGGRDIFDISHFLRTRTWKPMDRHCHLEMFPGQGYILLVAAPDAAARWRDCIVARMLETDRRQMMVDLGLAQHYELDVDHVHERMRSIDGSEPLNDLLEMRQARDELINAIYAAPPLAEPRSRLIQASAAICGCDGTLCRLRGSGQVDAAHELGLRLLPLTREMTHLRLQLRDGMGTEIHEQCADLSERTLGLLSEIRTVS